MERNPLWIGEVGIVRAVFGHAANVDPNRLLRIAPETPTGRVLQAALEERIGNRRLDVLVSFGDDDGRVGQRMIVEAKVGAVVDFDTLDDYLAKAQASGAFATGLLVAPYQPVGELPMNWHYQDLAGVAQQLSCPVPDEVSPCAVCREISYAVAAMTTSARVTEWRALTEATRHADIPSDWVMKGGGSSVGRPLVWFQSPWLNTKENSYVQVEAGNNFGLPRASVMLVALSDKAKERIAFPDDLWKAVALGCATAPALNDGISDANPRGRGARDERTAADARRNGVLPAWSLGFNMKGWHGRGRVLRHISDDYGALLPAAIDQGLALYNVAKKALRN